MIPYHQEYFIACSSHDLDTVERLYPKLQILDHKILGFKKACMANDQKIAKWIYEQNDISKEYILSLKTEQLPIKIIEWICLL